MTPAAVAVLKYLRGPDRKPTPRDLPAARYHQGGGTAADRAAFRELREAGLIQQERRYGTAVWVLTPAGLEHVAGM